MRIIHLLKHGVRGNGHVHVAVDLACAQSDAGHDVVFAAARSSYTDVLRRHGVEVVDLPEPQGIKDVPSSAWALARLCRRFRPDVVNAHMMSSAVLAYPIAKLLGVPLVTTMHNSFDKHSVLMRLGKVVVAVSEAERRLLLSRGYPEHQVVTIFNGADRSPREGAESDDPPLRRPCVATLSGLHPRKAVSDVITAFSHLAAEFPDWHLNVIGWGAERERLELQVAELGLEQAVHFLGSTPAPRPLLEQADIFATATLADPCPLTVMEARAAGCAIVATAVGGIPETLDHGGAGQLVPVHDPGAMAAALRRLMADPVALVDARARARAGAEYFTVERMSQDYLSLFASLTGLPADVRSSAETAVR
ncbi:glycosyltransferase family 4 protein [uncultured Friedmanniella sp.]|uniref:glycosyltransferase family 4 protein n=1 Tax=uncultured Friedmanniella sp. TaxID=335381 RepID=UPI0035CA6D63